MPEFLLGKLPPEPVKLKFKSYWDPKALPSPPAQFGHEELVTGWGMLANDHHNCCVWSGAAHEEMLWTRMGGVSVSFDDAGVLSDYSAGAGFNPVIPWLTDHGSSVAKAAEYRRTTGIVDSAGKRHKVAAYVALTPGDLKELNVALWLFGVVGAGVQLPSSAIDQFQKEQPWDITGFSFIRGGHYVPVVALRGNYVVVTWARLQPVRPAFMARQVDEAFAYLSEEALVNRKSAEGFDYDQLEADMKEL